MSRQLVVIGAGMGGLSAAIHARLAGWDVLVLEKGEVPGGKAAGIAIGEYQLDPGPSIIILPEIYQSVFERAGHKMEDYLVFDRLSLISRVYFEGQEPINLPADERDCLDLLKQMSKPDAVAMAGLLGRVDKVERHLTNSVYKHPYYKPQHMMDPALFMFGLGSDAIRPFKALVNRMFTLPLLRAFFYGFPSYGGQTYNSVSPGSFLIPFYMIKKGVFFPRGGVRAIPEAFFRLAKELGVDFRFGCEVDGFVESEGRVKSVRLKGGEHVEAYSFISNLDRSTFCNLAGPRVDAEPSFSYFTVHWGISKEIQGLEHHNLFIPASFEQGFKELYERGEFPTEPIVYLNSTAALDAKAAPPGKSNLFAVVTSPAKRKGLDWPTLSPQFRNRVRSCLTGFGLTWAESETDFERLQTPDYFESTHGNYRGSLYGLSEKHRLWGMFPAANVDARWKNLAFCGGSVQPGAGLPMVVLSGRFAAEILSQANP